MSLRTAEENSPALSFACVVLAAGNGRRFGVPKSSATLPDGSTFTETVVRTARACGANPVIAVMGPTRPAPAGAIAAENPDPSSPQIRSVQIGLARLANSSVSGALLWPVDAPLVRRNSVEMIIDAASERKGAIVVPSYAGRGGHPTYFDRDVWPELMVADSDGARGVVRRDPTRVLRVAVDDPGVVADIDTHDDLQRALGEAGA